MCEAAPDLRDLTAGESRHRNKDVVRLLIQGLIVGLVTGVLTLQFVSNVSRDVVWPGPFQDWRTYTNAVTRLLDGLPIYSATQLAGPYSLNDVVLVGYAYPPASVPLLFPFLTYPLGLAAWMTLNLGLLITALWSIVSRGWPSSRVPAMGLALVGLTVFPPFAVGLLSMNANVGIAGLIGWVAVGRNSRWAGLTGAFGAVLKVFAGGLALATESKVQALISALIIFLVIIVLTLPVVGAQSYLEYVSAIIHSVPDCRSAENLSIACALAPTLGLSFAVDLGLIISILSALLLTMVRHPLWMAMLVAICVMAPAYNLHAHYWIIVYVLMVAGLADLALRRRMGDAYRENFEH